MKPCWLRMSLWGTDALIWLDSPALKMSLNGSRLVSAGVSWTFDFEGINSNGSVGRGGAFTLSLNKNIAQGVVSWSISDESTYSG